MGINAAFMSNIRSQFIHRDDYYNIQKLGACLYINRHCNSLPKNISKAIDRYELTDMSDKLPITYVKSELGLTETDVLSSDMVIDTMTIAGKRLYQFHPDVVRETEGHTPYVLNAKEYNECKSKNQILGSIPLRSDKFFVWY